MEKCNCLPRSVFLTIILFYPAFFHTVLAQGKTRSFKLSLQKKKFISSLYDTVYFVDGRDDTIHMGSVQVGLLSEKADIVIEPSFASQFASLSRLITNHSGTCDKLFFQLRKISFADWKGNFSERGYFKLRAALFSWRDGLFYKIATIDTLAELKRGDMVKSLMKTGSAIILQFINDHLQDHGTDSAVNAIEFIKPDSVEKSKIRLYTTTTFLDGMYKNYLSFSRQKPDNVIAVSEKKDVIKSVHYRDSTGAVVNLKSSNAYAIVHKGVPYIVTPYGYCLMQSDGADFYFTGKVKNSADPMAGFAFGLVGSLLSTTGTSTYFMKIDHVDGTFIRIKLVPDQENIID